MSNPLNITLAATFTNSSSPTSYFPYNLAVSGKYLYVADYKPAVYTLDISNPTNPVKVSSDFTDSAARCREQPTCMRRAAICMLPTTAATGLIILSDANPASLAKVGS